METTVLSGKLVEALRAPFPPEDISWKPQTVNYKDKTALAVAFADPRAYIDRLNEVFGVGGWSDSYKFIATPYTKVIKGKKAWKDQPATEDREIPGNKLVVVATIHINGTNIEVSSTGDCDASDDNAATSAEAQAFKRAAMKLGLGRYLYELPKLTVGYDGGRWTETPALPDWALPRYSCDDCQKDVESVTHGDRTFSVSALIRNSQAKYKKNLCAECQKQRTATSKVTR